MFKYKLSLIFLFATFPLSHSINCSSNEKCPSNLPCCSPYGECGTGTNCINRCNAMFSYHPDSCLPQPVLLYPYQIQFPYPSRIQKEMIPNYSYFEMDLILNKHRLIHFDQFLVTPDPVIVKQQLSQYDFIYSGHTFLDPISKEISLRMPSRTKGSLLATTKQFLYGKCQVTLKSAKSQGVITAIVLISSVGDEIDFEFLGNELVTVQSNYFHLGNLDYTKMKLLPTGIDHTLTWHTYQIDWNEERIHWIIDGKILRTVHKFETWDYITKKYIYPQTPVRLEIAIWPGGDINLPPGTAEWAGGFIDWDRDPELTKKGYFEATVKNILVQPYMNFHKTNIVNCIHKGTNRSRVTMEDLKQVAVSYNPKMNSVFTDKALIWKCSELFYLSDQQSHNIQSNKF